MLFLDEVLEVDADRLTATKRLTSDFILAQSERVSVLVALELFAQAAAAFYAANAPMGPGVMSGALIGCRKLECSVDQLSVGDELVATIEQRWGLDGLAQFEGTLTCGGDAIATATFSVASGS